MSKSRLLCALSLATLLSGCAADPADVSGDGDGAGGKADDTDANPHDVVVQSVWREMSSTAGKQYMAILGTDLYTATEQFLIFGKKAGKLSVRSFPSEFWIFDKKNSTESAADNFYQLEAKWTTDDLVEVTLVGQDGRQHDLVYERMKIDIPVAQAIAAADKFYAKFDELLAKPIAKLAELKALVALHGRMHSYYPSEEAALPWQFEIESLQIEASTQLTLPDDSLAGVDIEADGSDPISKLFLAKFGQPWTAPADVPEAEDALEGWDWESGEPEPAFYTFEPAIRGVEPGMLRDGLAKFAKYTITEFHPWECEDWYDYDFDYHWVLTDGSILSHDPYPECD